MNAPLVAAQSGPLVIVYWIITALIVLLIVRAVLSWFPPGGELFETVNRFTVNATEWMLAPVRRVMPPLHLGGMALDLSFRVVLLVLIVLQGLVS